ncbi:transposase [Salsuginibacillus kocurii]|uniref:transposase n=1 Tax=Salsuginibacillus kocurii TaxID=427078 RepID=UPI000367CAC0|nr:transposase [Salsuginibacillus kocurii]
MARNRYSTAFKRQVVKEVKETGNTSWIARKYVISVGLIHRWKVEHEKGKLDNRSKTNV